jgi:hypothetical protein
MGTLKIYNVYIYIYMVLQMVYTTIYTYMHNIGLNL